MMNTAARRSPRGGFTLIEVSLAVLVVGIGLLSVFSLFPSGLRSGEDAAADTRAGMFATVILEGMRANAAGVNVWADWANDALMVGSGSKLNTSLNGAGSIVADGTQQPFIEFPAGSGRFLRYSLAINRAGARGISADLKVWERNGFAYSEFYTEFTYGGR